MPAAFRRLPLPSASLPLLLALLLGNTQAQPQQPSTPAAAALAGHDHAHGPDAGKGARPPAAPRAWTRYPLLQVQAGGERGSVNVRALNLPDASLRLLAPESTAESLVTAPATTLGPAGALLRPPSGQGNYHWLSARSETPEAVTVAGTAHYFPNPGPSPTGLLLLRKSELEIVPQPLPREHAAYRESEKWNFLVRFNGQALAGKDVVLETESGSRVRATTNSVGMATVVFPRDTRDTPAAGSHRPAAARFVLAVEHEADGRHYLTAFNHLYRKDPDRERSLGAGAGFLLLGMLGALPLLRRRAGENADATPPGAGHV